MKKHDELHQFKLKTGQPDFHLEVRPADGQQADSPWALLNQVAAGGTDLPDHAHVDQAPADSGRAATKSFPVGVPIRTERSSDPAADNNSAAEPAWSRRLLGQALTNGRSCSVAERDVGAVTAAGTPLKSLLKHLARVHDDGRDHGEGTSGWR